ncbi:GntR family transcriptional regulator [Naasia lichenicola]|uniref:GntR family transcriptional regulator n=2 Tax=Naasia lichenicola TaxID=2565933 RepID=A0A4S4FPS0_9MICO|nr:GntR family transcriptional regulator [Naasia lichenicola]
MTSPTPIFVGPIADDAPSLTERAIQAIRLSIRNGTMIPGELYTINQLASELGVSRSPVRDALLRLEETGVVKFERYRGFRLQMPGPRELAELFAVRVALEIPAARKAAARATDEQLAAIEVERSSLQAAAAADDEPDFMFHDQRLHGLVLDFAGNQYARAIIDNIRDATRLVGASTIENYRSLVEVYEEHMPIIDAMTRRSADAAAAAMAFHLRQTGLLLIQKSIGGEGTDAVDASQRLWDELVAGPDS